jgi:hypothetical protein
VIFLFSLGKKSLKREAEATKSTVAVVLPARFHEGKNWAALLPVYFAGNSSWARRVHKMIAYLTRINDSWQGHFLTRMHSFTLGDGANVEIRFVILVSSFDLSTGVLTFARQR